MVKPGKLREERAVREATERAARSAGPPLLGGAVDLSREAIALRDRNHSKLSARELGDRAASVLEAAHRAQRIAAGRRGGARQARAEQTAKEALLTAAVQIRIVERCGLNARPLHVLSFSQVQKIEDDVRREIADNSRHAWGVLAVDTHTRIKAHRARCRQEA